VALSGLRAALTLPSFLDPALVELTFYIRAQRNRSSPDEPIPTLMVTGTAGIAVQAAGLEVSQYLSDAGVTSATNAGIVADLSTALTAILAGDNRTAALACLECECLATQFAARNARPQYTREMYAHLG
jgi:hypothetical protein